MADENASSQQMPSEVELWSRYNGRIFGLFAGGIVMLGTVVYHLLEDWSWVDSFYFSTVAVSTVGFGDLTPTTDVSKLFTVFYLISGITIFATWLNTRLKHRVTTQALAHRPSAGDDAVSDETSSDDS